MRAPRDATRLPSSSWAPGVALTLPDGTTGRVWSAGPVTASSWVALDDDETTELHAGPPRMVAVKHPGKGAAARVIATPAGGPSVLLAQAEALRAAPAVHVTTSRGRVVAHLHPSCPAAWARVDAAASARLIPARLAHEALYRTPPEQTHAHWVTRCACLLGLPVTARRGART